VKTQAHSAMLCFVSSLSNASGNAPVVGGLIAQKSRQRHTLGCWPRAQSGHVRQRTDEASRGGGGWGGGGGGGVNATRALHCSTTPVAPDKDVTALLRYGCSYALSSEVNTRRVVSRRLSRQFRFPPLATNRCLAMIRAMSNSGLGIVLLQTQYW